MRNETYNIKGILIRCFCNKVISYSLNMSLGFFFKRKRKQNYENYQKVEVVKLNEINDNIDDLLCDQGDDFQVFKTIMTMIGVSLSLSLEIKFLLLKINFFFFSLLTYSLIHSCALACFFSIF